MSMPSDVTSDISEAVETIAPKTGTSTRLTREQSGVAAAALVAFVGVAFLGPALSRALQRQRRLEERIARRARDMHHRARTAGRQAQKRIRRLGDQALRR